jgi:glycosyltransferase involved in cell wall biosynthesis
MAEQHVIFIGLSGYDYPHTRVRCYNFAEQLNRYPGISTRVISFRDHLSSFSEVEVYQARDRHKLLMIARALPRIFPRLNTWFYIQKAHYNSALPFLLARLGFNKFIFDYDDYDVELNVTFNSMWLRRLFYGSDDHETITQRLVSRATGCIAASRSLYEYVGQFNPRVEYISTGVKPELFQCVDRSDRTGSVRFLWNGIVWGEEIYQGIMRVFNGLRAVRQTGLDARLQIVGTGQMWDRMIDTLDTQYSDLLDSIDATGWVSPDRMPDILAGADIGLLPFSMDNQWIRSKSPTKLFEYMASGIPVIADAIGEVTHVIQDGQSGILATSQQSFNDAMIGLADNRDLRLLLGAAARKRVETHYSIPVLVDRLARFLDMLFRLRR